MNPNFIRRGTFYMFACLPCQLITKWLSLKIQPFLWVAGRMGFAVGNRESIRADKRERKNRIKKNT